MTTSIPYARESWSPVTGCSRGCPYCWSRALAHRFKRSFAPQFHADKLAVPLHWRKPRTVVVAFNGDLFDPAITDEQIAAVFGVMAACPSHKFLVLTKRAERMARWFAWLRKREEDGRRTFPNDDTGWLMRQLFSHEIGKIGVEFPAHHGGPWPLPSVWLGVSVTNQADADERIPHLLRCPAAVRWVSAEPLLGQVDLSQWLDCPLRGCEGGVVDSGGVEPWGAPIDIPCPWEGHSTERLHWVVAGFQSGPHAPPGNIEHAYKLRNDCAAAGVPFAFKNPTGFPPLDGVVHSALPLVPHA